jgi:thiamine biosynthesis lipoprotein
MTRSVAMMGTIVTIQVAGNHEDAIDRAFGWFRHVESCCSRFDAASELRQLTARVGAAVPASDLLYEAVQFAVAVAEETGGAFDPTVGHQMEVRGFDRDYRSGAAVRTLPEGSGVAAWRQATPAPEAVSFRDIELDPDERTITLRRPLVLDLGAVVKGLAIDLASRELQPFEDFAIDAGGDLYLGGRNPEGQPWSVGIRHPRLDDELLESVRVSDAAVCTSGDYERRSPTPEGGHHILDPRTHAPAAAVASATVIAPTAMLADALATAAFVLGPIDGLRLIERHGLNGLIVTPALDRFATAGFPSEQR